MRVKIPLVALGALMATSLFVVPTMAAPTGTPQNTQTYGIAIGNSPCTIGTAGCETITVVSSSNYAYGDLPGAPPCPTTTTSDTWTISGLQPGQILQGQLVATYITSNFTRIPLGQTTVNATADSTNNGTFNVTISYPPSSQWQSNEIHVDDQFQVSQIVNGQMILVGPVGMNSGLDVFGTCGGQTTTTACPATPGFWKNWSTNPPGNQKNLWPVNSLLLGSHIYTEQDLVGSNTAPTSAGLFHDFNPSNSGDASMILAYQLFAAKLNAITGSEFVTPTVQQAINNGDFLLAQAAAQTGQQTLPFNIAPSSSLGQQMTQVGAILDLYNNSAPNGCKPLR